jgi:hypothetical protein
VLLLIQCDHFCHKEKKLSTDLSIQWKDHVRTDQQTAIYKSRTKAPGETRSAEALIISRTLRKWISTLSPSQSVVFCYDSARKLTYAHCCALRTVSLLRIKLAYWSWCIIPPHRQMQPTQAQIFTVELVTSLVSKTGRFVLYPFWPSQMLYSFL